MFDIALLTELILDYGYLIIFLGTLINYSGIPVFIVLAALLHIRANLDLRLTILSFLTALLLADILLFKIGEFFSSRDLNRPNRTKFKKFSYAMLKNGTKLFLSNQLVFYLFSKLFPIVGKYTPIFVGYVGKDFTKSIRLFFIGDCLYGISFFVLALFIGEVLLSYSRVVALLSGGVFLLIYAIFYFLSKKRIKDKLYFF